MAFSTGRSELGFFRKGKPLIHQPFTISSTEIPLLRSSARFSSAVSCLQRSAGKVDWISATRTPTKVIRLDDSERNQRITISESDHKTVALGLILNSLFKVVASLSGWPSA